MEKTAAKLKSEYEKVKERQSGLLGVHLGTGNNAMSIWPSLGEQSIAYMSSQNFTSSVLSQPTLHVVTKHELLSNFQDLLEQLHLLSWDEQAFVGLIVLRKPPLFQHEYRFQRTPQMEWPVCAIMENRQQWSIWEKLTCVKL
ncbi:hypothetical protein VMCG_10482 [Cytospora schulzeri]|uniref:Uncharacterized protein n=1 Tax=Cytospora schulzeri TaxID=448051 RepID=A0A423VBH9_9PEZI|nr:hypothetical protein VMCG_10482 [Valsa malicola]